jgi:hypothetical protein
MRIPCSSIACHCYLQEVILKPLVCQKLYIVLPFHLFVYESDESKALLFPQRVEVIVLKHLPSLSLMHFLLATVFCLFCRIFKKQISPNFLIPPQYGLSVFFIRLFLLFFKTEQTNAIC